MLLVGAAATFWFVGREDKPQTAAAFATATVQKGTLAASISGTGSIEAASREKVSSGDGGTVEDVFFQEGDLVKKGDVLITFEQKDTVSQINSKQLELKRQQLELEQLQLQYKQSAEAGQETLDAIRISIEKQRLTIQGLEDDIANLQGEDAIAPIVAPIDGKLVSFSVEPGDLLREDTEIGEVVNYDAMKIVVSVDELDIASVALDQDATVLVDALPEKTFAGKVVEIAEEGTSNNGVASFDVTVLLSEVDQLKAGMSAEASITTASREETLFLPIDAVQSAQGRYFVLVPGDGDGSEEAGGPRQAGQAGRNAGQGGEGQTGQRGDQAGQSEAGQAGQREGGQAGQRGAEQAGQSAAGQAAEGAERGGRRQMAPGGGARVFVETGIHNEDYIEIVSGLREGDPVILPAAAGNAASLQNRMNMGGGFGGGMSGGVRIQGGGFGGGMPPGGGRN